VRLYLRLLAVNVRAQLQYPASFVLDTLGAVGATLFEFIIFAAAFGRFGSVGGWSLGEVAFLYGLTEVAFAAMDMVFSGYDPAAFSQLIQRGQFDQMLLRPVRLPVQIFGSEFVLRRLGRIAQGAAVFAIGAGLAQIAWTPAKLAYLPVVWLSAVAFYGGLFVIGSTLCFWTVQPLEVVNIFTYGGTTMLSYPLHIYQDWIQRFFTFVVPGALVIYYPALFFLDRPDPLGLPAWAAFLAPLAGFGVLGAAFAFWRLGVRRYTSTGT
jgi:ABC-2 type transport system permease protein